MTSTGQDLRRPLHKRVLRVLTVLALAVLLLPFLVVAGLMLRMVFGPVNITPLARPFLPVTVMPGAPHQPPAARLTLGRAELRWNGLHDGWSTPVMLDLHNLRILKTDSTLPDTIEDARITLAPLAMLHGSLALRTVDIEGVRLALRRGKDGSVGLDVNAPSVPPDQSQNNALDPLGIERLSVHNARVTVNDQLTGTRWLATPFDTTLHLLPVAGKNGVTGTVTFSITGEETHARLDLTASGTRTPENTVTWHLSVAPTQPDGFAKLSPALKDVGNTVSLNGDAIFAPAPHSFWLLPHALDLLADIGKGPLTVAHSHYLLNHGTAAVHLDLNHASQSHIPATLSLTALRLDLLDPNQPDAAAEGITVNGHATLSASDLFSPQALSGQASLEIPQIDFTNIAQFWPEKAAKGGRLWVKKNITQGLAHDLHVAASLHSDTGWNGLNVTGITGGVDATGLTVHWLRPISPLQGMNAHLEVDGMDKLHITFDHAYQLVKRADKNVGATGIGRVEAGPGSMDITGLTKKDQDGTIKTALRGNLRDILALLAEPRLHLLSRHPISFTKPSGNASVMLSLTLPLESDVTTDQMTINAHADLTRTYLGNVVMGRAITNGRIQIDATTQNLNLTGHAALSSLPSDVSYFMDFRALAPTEVAEKAHVITHITPTTAIASGFAVGDHFYGNAELQTDYTRLANNTGKVELALNLTPAKILIPLWHKAAGRRAQVSAELALVDGHITAVNKLLATGPNLDVRGQARLRPNRPPELLISSFRIDRSTGHARLVLPYAAQDKTIRVGVYASTLDLSPLMEGDPTAPKPANTGYHVPEAATGTIHGPPGNAWVIDLQADSLFYNQTRQPLKGVKAHFEDNGMRLESMHFTMRGPSPVAMHLTPNGSKRSLHVAIPDMGAFLAAFNILPNVEGGQATLQGNFDDTLPSAPFKGVLNITPFVLTKTPSTVLIARNLSLYGWINARKAPEFEISHLTMPVTFKDGVLGIQDGRAGNDALGATLEGKIDLDRNVLDLNGTVVPAFAINKLPGKLPAIGRLFSPEKDGGLVAMKFGISGKLDNPDLHVNPYSIFLPGMLRKLF